MISKRIGLAVGIVASQIAIAVLTVQLLPGGNLHNATIASSVKQDPEFVKLFGAVDKLAKLDTDKDGIADVDDDDIDNDAVPNRTDTDVDNDGTPNIQDISTATIEALRQSLRGADGSPGARGQTGATGQQGATGQAGVNGQAGAAGRDGVDGAASATGAQGPAGPTGPQGPQGVQGAQGATGATGAQGATGATGATGAQGQTGAQGATGAQGTTGAQGPAGAQGATGQQGATGAQGPSGTVGSVTNDGVISTTITNGDLDIQLKLAVGSGLIKLGSGLSLSTQCSNAQLLKWNGSGWACADDSTGADWKLAGNSGTNPTSQFLGTTDSQPLVFRTNNSEVARLATNGRFGVGTDDPQFTLDVNGSFRFATTPTVSSATSFLTKDPSTGQVQQQDLLSRSILKTANSVNAGTAVQLDNIQVRLASSGNRSLQIAAVNTSFNYAGTSMNNFVSTPPDTGAATTITGYLRNAVSDQITTSWQYWQSGANFEFHGSNQTITIEDRTNNRAYRISLIIGYSYSNNKISIERLY